MSGMPLTREEEIAVLDRMMQPVPVRWTQRGSVPLAGLRITEAYPARPKENPLAAPLAQERASHRRYQWEVCRGLVLVALLLVAGTVRAAFDHDTLLTIVLGALAIACVPLYLLATPRNGEVR